MTETLIQAADTGANPEQVVEVTLKAPEKGKEGPPPAEIISPQEGIDDLKKALEQSKAESARRLSEFQRQIDEAAARANRAETQVLETQRDHVAATVDLVAKEREAAKRDYAEAMAAGEFAKAAEAQERMALAAARQVKAEEGKLALEDDIKARHTQNQGRNPQQDAVSLTPAENMARNMEKGGNYRSAAWIRQHPEYANDPQLGKKAEQAHYAALGDGHSVESDGYFQVINEKLGLVSSVRAEPRVEKVQNGNQAPLSAPVTRQSGGYQPGRKPDRITLTSDQAAVARELGMSYEAYANHLWESVKEGKIDPKNLNIG